KLIAYLDTHLRWQVFEHSRYMLFSSEVVPASGLVLTSSHFNRQYIENIEAGHCKFECSDVSCGMTGATVARPDCPELELLSASIVALMGYLCDVIRSIATVVHSPNPALLTMEQE
ncbi:hypothetical protein J6590_080864, partial [Homalodisca vitripennis]